jgi:hypothetical protein
MPKEQTEKETDGIKELKKFYEMKKKEQSALEKLLLELKKNIGQSNSEEKTK